LAKRYGISRLPEITGDIQPKRTFKIYLTQAIGRLRGGWTTKIHTLTDVSGRPWMLSARIRRGQRTSMIDHRVLRPLEVAGVVNIPYKIDISWFDRSRMSVAALGSGPIDLSGMI
jgi:hypothetical protein